MVTKTDNTENIDQSNISSSGGGNSDSDDGKTKDYDDVVSDNDGKQPKEERKEGGEHSPEAAGVARGATRAAQKSLIGRLPKVPASSSAAKSAAKRVGHQGGKRLLRRRVRGGHGSIARRRVVARVSDRISQGADIVGSAVEIEETASSSSSSEEKRSRTTTRKQQSKTNESSAISGTVDRAMPNGEINMGKRIFLFSSGKNVISFFFSE
eukprot:280021-Ditylum_brightwellii.AAC.1